jgi:toxin YoeB
LKNYEKTAFLPRAFSEFSNWATEAKKIYAKIVTLIKDIDRNPFAGLGKPEPLKYQFAGLWSRQITDEHRLVYKVTEDEVLIISCRFHYQVLNGQISK